MALADVINYSKEIGTAEIFNRLYDYSFQSDNLYLEVKDENSKLQKTNDIIYIIWNLPYMITCPNATESCKEACYASTPETDYRSKNTVPYRYRNLAECTGDNSETFVKRMIATIEKRLTLKSYKGKKVRVRIHESGDFFSKEYAMQWLEIAKHFSENENIVFMAYTKSFSFFDCVSLPDNFFLRASIWQDTKKEDIETIKKNNWSVYMAVPSEIFNTLLSLGFTGCDCENCSTCEKHCFSNEWKYMVVKLHGRDAKKLEKDIPRLLAIAKYLTSDRKDLKVA